MPHIPIIIDCIAFLEQVDQYHETISTNIANEMYEGKQLEEAQTLLANADSMLSTQRQALEDQVGAMELFLGI